MNEHSKNFSVELKQQLYTCGSCSLKWNTERKMAKWPPIYWLHVFWIYFPAIHLISGFDALSAADIHEASIRIWESLWYALFRKQLMGFIQIFQIRSNNISIERARQARQGASMETGEGKFVPDSLPHAWGYTRGWLRYEFSLSRFHRRALGLARFEL